jgi:hypothetical protein
MPGLIVTYFLEKSWHLESLKIVIVEDLRAEEVDAGEYELNTRRGRYSSSQKSTFQLLGVCVPDRFIPIKGKINV